MGGEGGKGGGRRKGEGGGEGEGEKGILARITHSPPAISTPSQATFL